MHDFGDASGCGGRRSWSTIITGISRLGVGVIVLAVAFGATKLKTNVHLLKMFDSDSKIIQDYAWLENNLGRLVPMELVVRMRPTIAAPLTSTANEDTDAKRSRRWSSRSFD